MMFFKKQENETQGQIQNSTLTSDELEEIDKLIAQNLKKFFKKNKKLLSDEEEDCYLLPSDIKDIIDEFSDLERQIKGCEHEADENYISLLSAIVESTIRTRIKELSRQRMAEKVKEIASADAKDYYQTPRYYRSWRNWFRKTPNRAMELILEQEELEARKLHLQQQIDNDNTRRQIEQQEEEYANGISEEQDEVAPEEEQTDEEEDVAMLPVRRVRSVSTDEEEQGD
ncbi:MAG: hypothetical protein ACI4MQ_07595 [Candidatus Coproplasma sp.]